MSNRVHEKNHVPRVCYGAFTLIEVLLALSLAAVVVAVAGRVAVSTLVSERAVTERMIADQKMDYLFDSLAQDFDARFEGEVIISLDPNHRPTITMKSLAPAGGDEMHVPRTPAEVTYRLVREGNEGDLVNLRRAVRDLTKPDATPFETMIGNDIAVFDVEVFERERWQPLDAAVAARLKMPRGLRIVCRSADRESPEERVFVLDRLVKKEPGRGPS